MPVRALLIVLACVAAFAGYSARAGDLNPSPGPAATALYDPQALPAGEVGESIRYGHDIIVDTQHLLPEYVRAKMDCSACHLEAGTKARGGSFVGTYAYFPQYNKRSHRVIALQDRLSECFLYSMNGRPPNPSSKAMVALVAYIAWLSRGTPSFSTPAPANRFVEPLPSASPDLAHGAAIYQARCTECHQANGGGVAGAFPPLWGPDSFNSGAGMAHIDRMTGFVMHNMPVNAPGSLSLSDSYDVAAFVLSHNRPAFDGKALVEHSPLPAEYY
jgi:thiosulfate dehydrogenase